MILSRCGWGVILENFERSEKFIQDLATGTNVIIVERANC